MVPSTHSFCCATTTITTTVSLRMNHNNAIRLCRKRSLLFSIIIPILITIIIQLATTNTRSATRSMIEALQPNERIFSISKSQYHRRDQYIRQMVRNMGGNILSCDMLKQKQSSVSLYLSSSTTELQQSQQQLSKPQTPLWPKVGDIVRYDDLDGGKVDGQVLIGRISFIQEKLVPASRTTTNDEQKNSNNKEWLFDIIEMEHIGEGYYTDYSISKRSRKRTTRNGSLCSPIAASYVRTQDAYKIPFQTNSSNIDSSNNNNIVVDNNNDSSSNTKGIRVPMVKAQTYDFDTYPGPFYYTGNKNSDDDDTVSSYYSNINTDIIESDRLLYDALKGRLIRTTVITGVLGTIIATFIKGIEIGILYSVGSIASVLYLLLLSLKTDTVASKENKFGNNLSNLRFFMPVLVLIGVALYNTSLGPNNPVLLLQLQQEQVQLQSASSPSYFTTITSEQFAATMFGFLTYRIPLFVTQIQDGLNGFNDNSNGNNSNVTSTNAIMLPGSAGMALQMMTQQQAKALDNAMEGGSSRTNNNNLQTVLLISGPQYTGRNQLVNRFLQEQQEQLVETNIDNNQVEEGTIRFIRPKMIDKIRDPVTFERYEQRNEFLYIDSTGRYGMTKQSLQKQKQQLENNSKNNGVVYVVDADVSLARQIVTKVPNIRIVGVWIGLDQMRDFEERIENEIDMMPTEENVVAVERREELVRSRIKTIITEIEYGISSGIFEFTIINTNETESIRQLREAASYCI